MRNKVIFSQLQVTPQTVISLANNSLYVHMQYDKKKAWTSLKQCRMELNMSTDLQVRHLNGQIPTNIIIEGKGWAKNDKHGVVACWFNNGLHNIILEANYDSSHSLNTHVILTIRRLLHILLAQGLVAVNIWCPKQHTIRPLLPY